MIYINNKIKQIYAYNTTTYDTNIHFNIFTDHNY